MKNFLEFMVALGFILWLLIQSFHTILDCEDLSEFSCQLTYHKNCYVRGKEYSCITPNVQFYFNILIFSIVLMLIYLCCNFYTFLWMIIRHFRKLSSLLNYYTKQVKKQEKELWDGRSDQRVVLTSLKSPDADILLDLLAEKMGVEVALKILGMQAPILVFLIVAHGNFSKKLLNKKYFLCNTQKNPM